MIYFLRSILFILIIGDRLFVSATKYNETEKNDEPELFSEWELNFHKFINNYAANSNLLIRPSIQPSNRIPSVSNVNNYNRITVFNRTTTNEDKRTINRPLMKVTNRTVNRKPDHIGSLKPINLVKKNATPTTANLTGTANLNPNRAINSTITLKPNMSSANSTVSINQPSTTTINTSTNASSSTSELDQAIYTPKECGRSFDEDFLLESDLSNLALYTNKKDTLTEQQRNLHQDKKSVSTDNKQRIGNKEDTFVAQTNQNSQNASSIEPDANAKKLNDIIENKLENLANKVNYLKSTDDNRKSFHSSESKNETFDEIYSLNPNLNVENLIRNFNLSTTNQTELRLLKTILTKKEEYFHYGEKRIISGQRANPGLYNLILDKIIL